MIYRFAEYQLDTDNYELRRDGVDVAVEPQVFALLADLIEHRDRMVSKDELIERVWDGRFISDAALSSRVKSARQAVGDDGRSQRLIRTIHGRGFRFVGEIERPAVEPILKTPEVNTPGPPPTVVVQSTKPSIAVLPFGTIGVDERVTGLAQALPHELIAALARLRWLTVIARASSFQFQSDNADLTTIGTTLNVSYCLTGIVEAFANDLVVTVELADTRDQRVVFAERYPGKIDALAEMRIAIANDVVGALDVQIPLNEAQWARLSGMDHLDAWGAFHLGLQHMYRSNPDDVQIAQSLFERAISLDPSMARARAGISYINFQQAFMHLNPDRHASIRLARAAAEKGFELDPFDPFVNFSLGRSYWLEDQMETGIGWLERATDLCPSYAQGFYARAWHGMVMGEANGTAQHADMASTLSPIDPLHYAVLGVRGFGLLYNGDAKGAAESAERGAHICGNHPYICLGTSYLHACAGNTDRSAFWARVARETNSEIGVNEFLLALPFRDPDMRQDIKRVLGGHGIP